jgi:ankyrin repeat protein
MVSELLNKGANINSRSNDGQTALLYAAFWGQLPIVKLLLNRGANINVRSGIGYNALMYAVISRNLELVRELLKRGANTNGVLNRNNISANIRNAIIKHKAGLTIAKYKKTSNMRRRAASAKALNNVRTPNGRPLPPNAIRSIMSMLKPRSPQKMRV